jgi:hypothetical protein
VSDPDQFRCAEIGFELRKPGSWEFVPTSWSAAEWTRNTSQPFCVARRMHDDQRHAFPTLQATVRPFGNPTAQQVEALLQMQLDVLQRTYGDVELVDASAGREFSGHRALAIRAILPLVTELDGERIEMRVLNRIHVIFAPGRAISVGISTSADENYFDEAEITQMVESIRISGC